MTINTSTNQFHHQLLAMNHKLIDFAWNSTHWGTSINATPKATIPTHTSFAANKAMKQRNATACSNWRQKGRENEHQWNFTALQPSDESKMNPDYRIAAIWVRNDVTISRLDCMERLNDDTLLLSSLVKSSKPMNYSYNARLHAEWLWTTVQPVWVRESFKQDETTWFVLNNVKLHTQVLYESELTLNQRQAWMERLEMTSRWA